MEPIYTQGSLCWVNTRVDLNQLTIGDPIVYSSPTNSLVFHRLVEISLTGDSSLSVLIQGDADESTQKVELSHINYIGKEAFTIPKLGSIVDALLSHHILWIIVAVFVILACVPWESTQEKG